MNPVYYLSNKRPLSHNRSGELEKYKKIHKEKYYRSYAHLYSNLPTSERKLHTKLAYIYHHRVKATIPDVDNLSKPIIDAFSGVIYCDDKQVMRREAIEIELNDLQFITFEMTDMPEKIANKLERYISNKEDHIVLLAVSNAVLNDIVIGGF